MYKALTIAGSDSGGGAGIQADLKVFSAFGVYGASVLTALTAQNTRGVEGVMEVPAEFVTRQIDTVMGDIGADAVKTGMLANAEVVVAVAAAVRGWGISQLVVDPVMIAKSGHALLRGDARDALLRELVPLAALVTPNTHEARALTGIEVVSLADQRRAAEAIVAAGARAALVKGGHVEGEDAVDVLCDGRETIELRAPRVRTPHTHGTGCTLSAAIAAGLARGLALHDAVRLAKLYLTEALRRAEAVGSGQSPPSFFAPLYAEQVRQALAPWWRGPAIAVEPDRAESV